MRRALVGLTSVLALSACVSGPYEFDTVEGTAAACADLVAALPDSVAEQPADPVDDERVAAWGDPRIVLRCGVTPPAGLDPTSRCDDVDGIGWFTDEGEERTVFTTIGRSPDVSVEVPAGYEPSAAALVDVADAVKAESEAVSPCV